MQLFRDILAFIFFLMGWILIYQVVFEALNPWCLLLSVVAFWLAHLLVPNTPEHRDSNRLEWLELLCDFPYSMVSWLVRALLKVLPFFD